MERTCSSLNGPIWRPPLPMKSSGSWLGGCPPDTIGGVAGGAVGGVGGWTWAGGAEGLLVRRDGLVSAFPRQITEEATDDTFVGNRSLDKRDPIPSFAALRSQLEGAPQHQNQVLEFFPIRNLLHRDGGIGAEQQWRAAYLGAWSDWATAVLTAILLLSYDCCLQPGSEAVGGSRQPLVLSMRAGSLVLPLRRVKSCAGGDQ